MPGRPPPGVAFERHHTATAYVVAGERTLLLWHHRLRMWLPPGGHLEANEDPVEGACREAEEESGLAVTVIPPPGLLTFDGEGPVVLAPPAVILIEDIVRDDQPFHQHIDHVYFTRTVTARVDYDASIPHGPHHWMSLAELERAFSLPAPDGTVKAVAEDVRLLGLRAIHAAVTRG